MPSDLEWQRALCAQTSSLSFDSTGILGMEKASLHMPCPGPAKLQREVTEWPWPLCTPFPLPRWARAVPGPDRHSSKWSSRWWNQESNRAPATLAVVTASQRATSFSGPFWTCQGTEHKLILLRGCLLSSASGSKI